MCNDDNQLQTYYKKISIFVYEYGKIMSKFAYKLNNNGSS